jgi:hypothetical protein
LLKAILKKLAGIYLLTSDELAGWKLIFIPADLDSKVSPGEEPTFELDMGKAKITNDHLITGLLQIKDIYARDIPITFLEHWQVYRVVQGTDGRGMWFQVRKVGTGGTVHEEDLNRTMSIVTSYLGTESTTNGASGISSRSTSISSAFKQIKRSLTSNSASSVR